MGGGGRRAGGWALAAAFNKDAGVAERPRLARPTIDNESLDSEDGRRRTRAGCESGESAASTRAMSIRRLCRSLQTLRMLRMGIRASGRRLDRLFGIHTRDSVQGERCAIGTGYIRGRLRKADDSTA